MGAPCDLLLTNVQLPSGRMVDLSISEGRVVHAGSPLPAETICDCRGMRVIPGGCDLHVHMRDEQQAYKEDWLTGTRAALAGGVTVVVDQPNTLPPVDSGERVRERVRIAKKSSLCHFGVNGGSAGKAALADMWSAGVIAFGEIFIGASSYAEAVEETQLNDTLSFAAFHGALATLHAEEVRPGADTTLRDHDHLRPPCGETDVMKKLHLPALNRLQLHLCHVSTAAAVTAAPGTVEVTPHHLLLSFEDFPPVDGHGKVNPPLRSRAEQRALFATFPRVDTVGSDHAPHTDQEKSTTFSAVPSGFPGVETMIPLLLALVEEGKITLPDLISKVSTRPAEIIGIPKAGFSPGDRADFGIFPRALCRIDADELHSRAGWSPFEGWKAIFPKRVILGGMLAYEEGEFFPTIPRWFHGRGYHLPLQN